MKRVLYFLRWGHWPKRLRYPHGIPRARVSVWDIEPFNRLTRTTNNPSQRPSDRF